MPNNELQLRTGPYRTTFVGTEIIRQSTKEEWQNYGEILKRVDEAKQWAIGDWLVDGKTHYGDGLYVEAAGILGLDESTLRVYKNQSESFPIVSRRNNLSHAHHRELASIKRLEEHNGKLRESKETDMDKIQEFLSKAEREGLSVRELREVVGIYKRRQQEEIRLFNEPEKFSVILADPAWEYDFSRSDSRQIDNQYLPSTLEDMKRLQVPAATDCVLFMWATNPKLREALELIEAWDFEYKTNAVWIKNKIGMGYYFRQQHELLLIATRGIPQLPDEGKRVSSIIEAPRTEHSKKPGIIYDLIETMYPEQNKLELFARGKRDNWKNWGDEI